MTRHHSAIRRRGIRSALDRWAEALPTHTNAECDGAPAPALLALGPSIHGAPDPADDPVHVPLKADR